MQFVSIICHVRFGMSIADEVVEMINLGMGCSQGYDAYCSNGRTYFYSMDAIAQNVQWGNMKKIQVVGLIFVPEKCQLSVGAEC